MSDKALVRVSAATAAEVCAKFDLDKDAQQFLVDNMKPGEFVSALLAKKKYADAIDFMAHALPEREGIWWGCLCMQHALGDDLPDPDRSAATAVAQWVMQPGEERRIAAKAPADLAGAASPAGILAKAVFLSAGHAPPPHLPPKALTPFASAKAIARAVKLASTKAKSDKPPKIQWSYVDLAMEVAEGRLI